MITVIERVGSERVYGKWRPTWRCRCDCGNEFILNSEDIEQEYKYSCGCTRRTPENSTRKELAFLKDEDFIGLKFGRLTVLESAGRDREQRRIWLCRCECGNERICRTDRLVSGEITECKECAKWRGAKKNSTHGHSNKEKLYSVWFHMKDRCRNPDSKYYGAKGIKVCEEWDKDYMAFRKWALENGYKDGLTIDRIDVNGDYCPENCRWLTVLEQNYNKTNTILITCDGETHNVKEWAEITGLPRHVIRHRLYLGWGAERIIHEPKRAWDNVSNNSKHKNQEQSGQNVEATLDN